MPTGEGIGATQAGWAVMSLARPAGSLPIVTVIEPIAIMPGPAGTQLGNEQGADIVVTVAAIMLLIITVGQHEITSASGKPGWGTGVGTGAGGWIGA